jgi:hypothetical protein
MTTQTTARSSVWVDVDLIVKLDAMATQIAIREGVRVSRNEIARRVLMAGFASLESAAASGASEAHEEPEPPPAPKVVVAFTKKRGKK